MGRLRLLELPLLAGVCGALLANCSSAEEPAGRNTGSANGTDGAGPTDAGATGTGGAGTDTGATGSGASSATGAGATSGSGTSAGTTDAGGSPAAASNATTGPLLLSGVGGTFVGNRDDGNLNACQTTGIKFTPDIPTVFILVDRSTSMWENMFWDPLRDGVLEVVQRLEQDVRFGFGTFTGVGDTCPLDLQDAGTIDFNNYDTIAQFYTQIEHPGVATETPTAAGIQRAREILEADNATFPGPKFIMLVTDGNPDYCDNGDNTCRADTTVKVLQDTFAAPISTDSQGATHGIHTFVVALPDPAIDQEWLTAFANAGAGEAVSAPQETQYCSPVPADTAAILPTVDAATWPQATYGAAMGPLQPYNVDPAQKDQLVEEISAVIAGVKSCVFDLEGELQIVAGREDEGSVLIQTLAAPEGTEQPYDPTGADGWKVNNGTQIELVGTSCDTLRSPDTTGIEFGFPCDIIIPK